MAAAYRTRAKGDGPSRQLSTGPHRCRFSRAPSTSASLHAARRILPTSCSRRCVASSADTWRSPLKSNHRGHEDIMSYFESDALVFFGATGDLAYKKIFPSLQAMVKRGHLSVPIIGVAKSGWNVEQLRARARDSLEEHGGVDTAAFERLGGLLRYVDGDYSDPATYTAIRQTLGSAEQPAHYLAIPPVLFGLVVEQLGKSGCARNARVIIEKPFGTDLKSARELNQILLGTFSEPAIFRIDH